MARTITVRRDADDLSLATDDNHGGREVMDDLLRQNAARQVVSQRGGPLNIGRQSSDFFATISGASPGTKEYNTTRRNFQRYADGTRKPTLHTVEGYQARYELAKGERSPLLDDLIISAGGQVPDEDYELPPGDLELEVMAEIKVTTGKKNKKQRSDVRTRSVVLDIPRARQRAAIADPLGEWIRQLEDSIPEFEIDDVRYIEARFTPKG